MTNKKSVVKTSARKKQYTAPALEKGLDILELLSGEPEGLAIGEITERLQKSVGELFRMLAVLEQREYVFVPAGSDRYTLTLKMFQISHRFPPVKRLTTISGPIMRELAYSVGQSCHLVVHYEGKGHVVVQQDSPSDRLFSVRLGADVPLINTCSGHVLLAFSDAEERTFMLDKIPHGNKKPNQKVLKDITERLVRRGFERIKSAQAAGVEDVGFPIFDYTGRVVAALIIPFVAHLDNSYGVNLEDACIQQASAASKLSERLGYAPDS